MSGPVGAAAATQADAQRAAERILVDGGSAVDALVAGFFAAAAVEPSALLCPLQVLVHGPGIGARAFDGRARQPGLGAKRPRGLVGTGPAPVTARVAVPASIGAVALAHAYAGRLPFERLLKPAVEGAMANGALLRAQALQRIAERGPSALRDAFFLRPLLGAAAAVEGGLLTAEDLAQVRPDSAAPAVHRVDTRRALLVPWSARAAATATGDDVSERPQSVVAVGDGHGLVAVLAYRPDEDGLAIPALELVLSRDAVEVRRGVTRVTPGETLPLAAPLVIFVDDQGENVVALGFQSGRSVLAPDLEAWSADPTPKALLAGGGEALRASAGVGLSIVTAKTRVRPAAFAWRSSSS